jgi:hypothetical protein
MAAAVFVFAAICGRALAAYCPAGSSQCEEYISDVHAGTIHNTSTDCSPGGYADYTAMTTEMEVGKSYQITVSNGDAYTDDQCGIWIDWNQDEDFNDVDETISVSGGAWDFQAEFTVPTGALLGQTRMRIRITYTGLVDSCGTTPFGEVEDYSIEVIPAGSYEIIHESATMAAFGQMSGLPFDANLFMGSRFYVDEQVEVSTIGGHLLEYTAGTVFGAIVSLSGPTALPFGSPLHPAEVAGSVVFTLPYASMDFRVPLSATLGPGDYALIFGSDQFGASVSGAGLIPGPGQSNLPGASYFAWDGTIPVWFDINPAEPPRFVVEGIRTPIITIGTGSSTSAYPLYTHWPDSRTQVIYLASEIGTGGNITALGLDVDTVPGIMISDWTIRMKHTELSSYGTNQGDYTPLDGVGWTVVHQSAGLPGSPGWRTFDFPFPFEYNGTDNLLIDFSIDNVTSGDSGWCRYSEPGGTRQVYARANNDYGDPLDWSGMTSPPAFGSDNVPNIQLTIAEIECGPAGYGGGCGTVPDPYLIYTAEQMNNIGANPNDWDKNFKLMNDIDLSGYTGTSFNLIGGPGNNFNGTFDGNGKKIFNFSYNSNSTNDIGLFRALGWSGTIKRLGLIDPNVSSGTGSCVGALVGGQGSSFISVGSVIDCYVEGGSVSGDFIVGGLVGNNLGGLIQNSYSTCSVTGILDWVGGLVGINEGVIINCYSTSDATGQYRVGGFVGENNSDGEIINCYSTGRVRGHIPPIGLGGFIGGNSGTVTDCFWNTETSGQNSSAGGTGKTTEEMQIQSTFTNWDFITPVWTICEQVEYPQLWKKGAKYGGGSGTVNDPYLILTPCQMQEIGTEPGDWDKHFKLMTDIDVGRFTEDEFNIIGNDSNRFTGVFNGNDHKISNFTYSIAGAGGPGRIAIFGVVDGASAQIRNLGVVDPNIEASIWFYVAPLVGQLKDGVVSNCYAVGGNVQGMWDTGGLAGSNQGTISECMSSVSVGGEDFTGGLVGANYGVVTDCYATGSVYGNEIVGGLVGLENDTATVDNCYASGSVSGISDIGGLVGLQLGGTVTVTGSFWDVNTSGLTVSDGGIPKTTTEMQKISTFTLAGWDFDNIWKICEDVNYPKHRWERYSGGNGTAEAPCLICSAEEMQTIGANPDDWDKYFKLIADIDLGGYTGTEFNIIGTFIPPASFTGSFDGDGHVISNFTYNSTGINYIGLFGSVGQIDAIADIKNLGLKNPQIDTGTGNNVGALVGFLFKEGTISNCYVEGGTVDGNSVVGGLLGFSSMSSASVNNCYSSTTVSGYDGVGGLVGVNNWGTITNCYSHSDVTGDDIYIGGLVGYNFDTVINCYATGSVSGSSVVGGLIGYNYGGANDSFWDIDTTGQIAGSGGGDPCGISAKTTAEMQTESTFTDAGWDFIGETANGPNDVWEICEGTNYPKLTWQIPLPGDFVCPDGVETNDLGVLCEQWLLPVLPADMAGGEVDGFVDFLDWAVFANAWQSTSEPLSANWNPKCDIAPAGGNGIVDIDDLTVFVNQWLQFSAYCADIAPAPAGDEIVNWLDFAVLAEEWLAGL